MIYSSTANLSLKNGLLSVPTSTLSYFINSKWTEASPWTPPRVDLSQFIRLVFFQSVQSLLACLHQNMHLGLKIWPTRNLHKNILNPTPSSLLLKWKVNTQLWCIPGLFICHPELLSFRQFHRFKLNGKGHHPSNPDLLPVTFSVFKLQKNQDGKQAAFIYSFVIQQSQYNHTRLHGSRIQAERDTYSATYCASEPVRHWLRRSSFSLKHFVSKHLYVSMNIQWDLKKCFKNLRTKLHRISIVDI